MGSGPRIAAESRILSGLKVNAGNTSGHSMDQLRFPLTLAAAPVLQALVGELGGALPHVSNPQADRIIAALGAAVAVGPWLPPDKRRANHERYARHLIHADPRGQFSILAIVWGPGQSSPIHAHNTWCGVAVYQGAITETFYAPPAGKTKPVEVRREVREKGSVRFDPANASIHQLSNHGKNNAITLHAYGIRGDLVSTGINRIFNNT